MMTSPKAVNSGQTERASEAHKDAEREALLDEIIDSLQSSFDTEGITENDSGDPLVRLSSAIAAVEDARAASSATATDGGQNEREAFKKERDLHSQLMNIVMTTLRGRNIYGKEAARDAVKAIAKFYESRAAAPQGLTDEMPTVTGHAVADRIINRLSSSDPDFDDCADAVDLIRTLVYEQRNLSRDLCALLAEQSAASTATATGEREFHQAAVQLVRDMLDLMPSFSMPGGMLARVNALLTAPAPVAEEADEAVTVKCELCAGVGQIGTPGQRCFSCDGSGNSKHQGLYRLPDNFKSPLTSFGLLVRALRIVAGTTLYDMAKALSSTPATLSAVECGRKPLTEEMVIDTYVFFTKLGVLDTLHALNAARAKDSK